MQHTLPSDVFAKMETRVRSFSAGLEIVLFFENQDVLDTLGNRQSLVASLAEQWSNVASGMAQHTSK